MVRDTDPMGTLGCKRMWAAAVAVVLAMSVAGCQAVAEPPPGTDAAVDAAASAMRDVPGVAGVSATVNSSGGSYGAPSTEPVQWSAWFTVRADASTVDLSDIAVAVAEDAQIGVVPATVVLLAPGGSGAAEVELTMSPQPSGTGSTAAQMADAALAVRTLPGVVSVSVSADGGPVGVAVQSPAPWSDLAAAIRAQPGFGSGALPAVSVREVATDDRRGSAVTIDSTVPSAGLMGLLDALSADTSVTTVSFDGVTGRENPDTWRPSLTVWVAAPSDVAVVAGRLADLADSLGQVDGIPRTSFDVAAFSDATTRLTGYLGLPLGSGEPDDTQTALASALPPAEAAARVDSDRSLLTALLDAAGDDAGIRGQAEITTTACTQGTGEQVQGSVVIPIFDIADSADEGFDAITAAWESAGITRSDRAMGRDFYTAPDGALESLSIRGTAEGISIMAVAPCVRSSDG